MSADSAKPEFWNERYLTGRIPWDFGGVPAALRDYLAAHPRGGRALVPGCGSGYEVEAFAAAGYDVVALDFSADAVARARKNLGPALAERIVLGDFFTQPFATPFDVIYERTFLCALPSELWPHYATHVAELLSPAGILAGLFFFGEKDDGPPFGLAPDELHRLLRPHFTLVTDTPVHDSLPLFAGRERWQEWRRTD